MGDFGREVPLVEIDGQGRRLGMGVGPAGEFTRLVEHPSSGERLPADHEGDRGLAVEHANRSAVEESLR